MTKRIIPDVMVPAETLKPGEEQIAREAQTEKMVTSRVENLKEGHCPQCGEVMRVATANGIPVHFCAQDSVTMPIRDTEIV